MRTTTQAAAVMIDHDIHRGSSANSILKLRRLISSLIDEVNSLDHSSLPLPEEFFSGNCDHIEFYEEVKRFEIALIKAALKKSDGHQLRAAQLLNLNPSTLNSKIKQYELRHLVL